MDIMIEDFKPEIQEQILEFLHIKDAKEGNYDVMPLFVLDEPEEDN